MKNILTLLIILSTYSLSAQDHNMNDQMDMPKDHSMQNMPMPMAHPEQKKEDQPTKNIKHPSVITPNVGSLPWTMDGVSPWVLKLLFHLKCSTLISLLSTAFCIQVLSH